MGRRVAGAEKDAAPRLGDPQATIGEAAQLLDGADHSCVLVRLPGGLGIATDHDFRTSLADASLSREAPLSAICSVPAVTVNEHTDAPTALMEMVERGIHHLVVTTDTGNPVGVVRVVDLASAEVRDPLLVRRSVTRARSLDDLREAAAIVPQTVLEMDEIGIPALRVSGILSTVRDLIVQRVVELTPTVVPTSRVSWLVLGSLARREALPHSDVDTALAWPALLDTRAPQLRADAELVLTGLEWCGLSRCPDGANATEPLFSRSVDDWEEATHRWTHHPESESALLLASIVADNRPVTHVDLGSALTQSMLSSTRERTLPQRPVELHPRRQTATRAHQRLHGGPHRRPSRTARPQARRSLAGGAPRPVDGTRRGRPRWLDHRPHPARFPVRTPHGWRGRGPHRRIRADLPASLRPGGRRPEVRRTRPTATSPPGTSTHCDGATCTTASTPSRRSRPRSAGPGHPGGRAGWTWRSARDVCHASGPWTLLAPRVVQRRLKVASGCR